MDILKVITSVVLPFVLLLALLAVAFLAGCAVMLQYRGPVKFRRFRGGPFRGQYNLGAYRPSDLYLTLASAIANASSRVGPRRGPDWPVGHPAHAEVQETGASWHTRAVMFALGVGVRMERRTQTTTAIIPVPAPLEEIRAEAERFSPVHSEDMQRRDTPR